MYCPEEWFNFGGRERKCYNHIVIYVFFDGRILLFSDELESVGLRDSG
jgi:hypothetical protein